MKKKYTKKQITEAIAYWKKQLSTGNYLKINESTSDINDLLQDLVNSERIQASYAEWCDSPSGVCLGYGDLEEGDALAAAASLAFLLSSASLARRAASSSLDSAWTNSL